MHYPRVRFGSLILTIVIFFPQVSATTVGNSIKMTAPPAALQSQTIKSQANAVSRQGGDRGFAATEHQSAISHQRGEHIKNVSVSPLSLYIRLWRFAFFLLLWSGAAMLLLLGVGYFRQRKDQSAARFAVYAREALGRRRWWVWLLIVTDVFLISNHLLVRGLAVGAWDVNDAYYPYQVLVADFARAGQLLQWDPWSNGGMPLGSDPETGAFSPLNVLIGLITGGTAAGFTFYWLLMWWLGSVGVLLLARHLKAPPWGGGVAALGFLFCGFYTGHAQHTSVVVSFSALPLAIWRLDVALGSRRLQPAVEAGAIWGLSALSGYPALTIFTGCYAALWALGRWLCPPLTIDEPESGEGGPKTRQRSGGRTVFYSLALMALVGSVVLLPSYLGFFYEGAGTHRRVGELSRKLVLSIDAFTPGALLTFASPYLPILKLIYIDYGLSFWPNLDISMCSVYAGAIVTVFAWFALINHPRDRWRWWLMGMGLLSLACAFGDTLPLRGWLYDWFYPTRFFRHPALFRAYFLFSLLPLALLTARDLAEALRKNDKRVWRRLFIVTALIAGGALLSLLFLTRHMPPAEVIPGMRWSRYLLAFGVWPVVTIAFLIAWRLPPHLGRRWLPLFFLLLAAGDALLTSAVSLRTVADVGNVVRWEQLDRQHSATLDLTALGLRRDERSAFPPPFEKFLNNDHLITKTPVLDAYTSARHDYHDRIARDPLLKSMAMGSDRIWFAREVAEVALTEENLSAYQSRAVALNGFPVIVHSPAQMLGSKQIENAVLKEAGQIANLPAAEKVTIKLLKYSPEELTFDVQCPADGWLLMTDRWARSWKGEVNGRQTQVYGGNFVFRAVQVSAGQNRIRFSYRPFAFPWLILLSWGMLAGILVSTIYRQRQRRPHWEASRL